MYQLDVVLTICICYHNVPNGNDTAVFACNLSTVCIVLSNSILESLAQIALQNS